MIKSAKLIQLSLGGMHVGGSDTDEDEAEKQSTLAQTLTMCKSLFEASGVTPGGVQHWALARAALVNLLTISNELAKMGTGPRWHALTSLRSGHWARWRCCRRK